MDCAHGTDPSDSTNVYFGCNGGDTWFVLDYMKKNGVPHASCEQYTAFNNIPFADKCTEKYMCRDCNPPPNYNKDSDFQKYCDAPKTYDLFFISSWGRANTT